MAIITENLFDLAGVSTTKPVQFQILEPRPSGAGETGMVVPNGRPVTVHPVAGVITTADLDPGPAVAYLDGSHFPIEIGPEGTTERLRDLIDAASVTPPSGPSWQSIVSGMLTAFNEDLATIYAPVSVATTKLDKTEAATLYVGNTPLGAEQIRTSDAVAMRAWRAALANRDNAPARLLLVGDSRTEGEGATLASKRWQNRLAAALRARFQVEGGNPAYAPINYVPVKYFSPTLAGQTGWSTPSAGHVTPNTFGLGARNVTLGPGHATTLTFTGTSCKIAYRRPSFAFAFNYVVDGGSSVPVSIAAGTEADGQTIDIGPLTAGVHTVTVTGVTNQLSLEGAYIYNGEETKGIQVFDSAKHGVRSDNAFGSNLALFKQCVAKVNPHCIYVGLGTNDHGGNINPVTYNTNMRALITALQEACTLPPTVVLAIDSGRTSGFTYPWSSYVTVLRGIAADNPTTITVLDLSVRLPALGDNTLGLYADTLHENNKGQAFRSDALTGFLSSA